MTAFKESEENNLNMTLEDDPRPSRGSINHFHEINETSSVNDGILIKSNSVRYEGKQSSPIHQNGHVTRCSSENNLSTVSNSNNSNIYFVPLREENQAVQNSLNSTESCVTSYNKKISHPVNLKDVPVDTVVSLHSNSSPPPNTPDENDGKEPYEVKKESLLSSVLQVAIPFVLAGIGTCGAGLLLDTVQHWDVFQNITDLLVVVPTLQGVKGDLEMALAARLSTQANIGNMRTVKAAWKMGWGNMVLKLAQSSVMGLLAAAIAIVISAIQSAEDFDYRHAMLIVCASMSTAAITTFILGTMTTVVVFVSSRCHINPDNIATPIVASLGDVVTLSILSSISNQFYYNTESISVSSSVTAILMCLIPFWIFCAHRNIYTKNLILLGWIPVVISAIITSGGGFILEAAVTRYPGMAIFQPVISGIGGNFVAIQASRIATYFHQRSKPGIFPSDTEGVCINPFSAFFGKHAHSRMAKVLVGMVVPAHLVFGYLLHGIKGRQTALAHVEFLPIYLSANLLQVAILLYIAHLMTLMMWKLKIDPDNGAIPILTAFGDLLGTAFLFVAFLLLSFAVPDGTLIITPTADISVNSTHTFINPISNTSAF